MIINPALCNYERDENGLCSSRFSVLRGIVTDYQASPLLRRGGDLIRFIYSTWAYSGESLAVVSGTTSPLAVVGSATGTLNAYFQYPGFRIAIASTSAGAPGRASLAFTYTTVGGVTTSDAATVVVDGVSETVLYGIAGYAADGNWMPSGMLINTVVVDSGPDTTRAATTLSTAFSPLTFSLSCTGVHPRTMTLAREFLTAFGLLRGSR